MSGSTVVLAPEASFEPWRSQTIVMEPGALILGQKRMRLQLRGEASFLKDFVLIDDGGPEDHAPARDVLEIHDADGRIDRNPRFCLHCVDNTGRKLGPRAALPSAGYGSPYQCQQCFATWNSPA